MGAEVFELEGSKTRRKAVTAFPNFESLRLRVPPTRRSPRKTVRKQKGSRKDAKPQRFTSGRHQNLRGLASLREHSLVAGCKESHAGSRSPSTRRAAAAL